MSIKERVEKVFEEKFRLVEGITLEWDQTNPKEVVYFTELATAILKTITDALPEMKTCDKEHKRVTAYYLGQTDYRGKVLKLLGEG